MQENKQGSIAGKLLFIFWAAFCVALFILLSGRISVLHSSRLFDWGIITPKLSTIEPLHYAANIGGAFFGAALFSLACISFGALFIRFVRHEENDSSPSKTSLPILTGSAFLIGSGLFSMIFLTLGGLSSLKPVYVIAITLAGLLLGLPSFVKLIKTHSKEHLFDGAEKTNSSITLIYRLSISIILLSLMYSSSRLSYDSVALYFSDAKITAMTNHVQFFLNDSFITSSFHTGIQYAVIIQMFGDQAARIYSWINGLVIVIFTLALGEQLGLSKSARGILLALLLTTTAFTDLLGDGKIDLATSAPAIAAIYWMVKNGIKARKVDFLFVGFLAGFAIIARPFNVFLLGVFFALFYLHQTYSLRNENGFSYKTLFNRFLWLVSALLGLAIFHLAANWMILGDPFAPFSNAAKLSASTWQWSFSRNEIWIFRTLYPLVVTFLNSPQSLGTISPLFLAFLPGIFIKDIREKLAAQKSLMHLTIMALVTLLLWILLFFTVVEIRYVLFIWIILFLPLAAIAEQILRLTDKRGKIMELFLIVVLLFVNFRVVYISLDTYSPVDKIGNAHCYKHPFCDYLRSINESAENGERVLTMNAYRYYLRSDLFACSTKADEYSTLREASLKGSNIFWEEVYRQGYTYLAYEKNYSIRHLYMDFVPDPKNAPSWMELIPIYGKPEGIVAAYKIKINHAPIPETTTCTENENGIWEVQVVNSE